MMKWITRYYRCRNSFVIEDEKTCAISGSILLENDSFMVHTAFLDHGIPCLAFSFDSFIFSATAVFMNGFHRQEIFSSAVGTAFQQKAGRSKKGDLLCRAETA